MMTTRLWSMQEMARLVEVVGAESCAVFALCRALPVLCGQAAAARGDAVDCGVEEEEEDEGTTAALAGLRGLATTAYRTAGAGSIPEVRLNISFYGD